MSLTASYYKNALLFILFNCFIQATSAKQLEIQPKITATTVYFDSELNNADESDQNRVYALIPELDVNYSGNKFSGFFNAEHTYVEREREPEEANNGFSRFAYAADLELIDNVLLLNTNGNFQQRAAGQRSGLVSDPFLNSGELSKTRTNSANLLFNLPNPSWIGIDWEASFSRSESDRQSDNQSRLDNDVYSIASSIYQGRNFTSLSWDIKTVLRQTSRQQLRDFKSRIIEANVSYRVSPLLALIATTDRNEYELDQASLNSSFSNFDTVEYGAGIILIGKGDSRLDLTWNTVEQLNVEEDYLGVRLNWSPSPRTSMLFDYSKRFYGDAYDFSLSYNLKNFRLNASYSEEVTTTAQLEVVRDDLGVLVCPAGSFELSECFQPNSLEYELNTNEVFTNVSLIDDFEINQQLQFRRAGILAMSYQRAKLTASLTIQTSDTEFLESGSTRENHSLSFQSTYAIGAKTNADIRATLSRRKYSENDATDDIFNLTTGLNHQFSKKLIGNINYRFIDRDSSDGEFEGKDNRISMEITYQF